MEARRYNEDMARQQRDLAMRVAAIQKAQAEKLAFERDPKNIARAKQSALKEKYGLRYFIEKTHFPKLIAILQKVEAGSRLLDEDVVWLSTTHTDYDENFFTRTEGSLSSKRSLVLCQGIRKDQRPLVRGQCKQALPKMW